MTQVLLLSSDAATASAVAAVLSELDGFSEPVTVASLGQARLELDRQDLDLVLVDENEEEGKGLSLLRELAALSPLLPVCLLAPRVDADLVIRAMDAGARAVLPLPPSIETYAERLRSLSAWTRQVRDQRAADSDVRVQRIGRIVAVIGAKGGVGTSMIALMAARAASGRGQTALLDFDLSAGDQASYCGLRVRHSVIDLVTVAAELGGREITEVAYPLRGGVELLPAPPSAEAAEAMTETAARQILQAIRYQYQQVVIDCGSALTLTSAAALDLADEIIIVATPDVPALSSVRRLTAAMDRLGIGRGTPVRMALNRSSRQREIQASTATKLAGMEILTEIPDCGPRLEPTINTGTVLDLDVAPFTQAGRTVADLLIVPEDGIATPAPAPAPPSAPSPAPARSGRRRADKPKGRRGKKMSLRGRRGGEEGQVSVEFAGVLVLALALFALVLHLLFAASVAFMAQSSAQEAARQYARGGTYSGAVAAAAAALPDGLAGGMHVHRSGSDTVTVTVDLPLKVPGLRSVSADATIDWEE